MRRCLLESMGCTFLATGGNLELKGGLVGRLRACTEAKPTKEKKKPSQTGLYQRSIFEVGSGSTEVENVCLLNLSPNCRHNGRRLEQTGEA